MGIDMLDVRERLRSSVAVMMTERMMTVGRGIIMDDCVKIWRKYEFCVNIVPSACAGRFICEKYPF
jgi:hypothetical protein